MMKRRHRLWKADSWMSSSRRKKGTPMKPWIRPSLRLYLWSTSTLSGLGKYMSVGTLVLDGAAATTPNSKRKNPRRTAPLQWAALHPKRVPYLELQPV